MILVDTSVWVNHLRHGDAELARMLVEQEVALHPFIIGEIAAGSLTRRSEVLGYLFLLHRLAVAQEEEVHHLLESRNLWGTGLGWTDLHILTAAKLSGCRLYTADRAMNSAAVQLEIAYRR